jgi:putative ABC transport system permease protein
MLLTETIRVALSALRANKMRSLLTMLGIVIGIGSVITMVSLGNGAAMAVRDRIAKLGTTVIQINPQRVQQAGAGSGNMVRLTTKDVAMIRERSPNVLGVNYQQDRPMQVAWKTRNANVQVTGTNENFLEVRGFKLALGRMLSEADDRGRRKVAVVGAAVLPLLGSATGADLIGERIRIAGRAFTVIGVLENRGVTGVGDADEQILIPFETGRYELFGTDRIQDIWARAASEDSLMRAMFEIQSALRRSQRLRAGSPNNFTMRNQSDFLVALEETTQVFTLLLAGIAAVSLLVGGIGIMNIMLVSVTERTREIGVRKALGATRWNILLQFLTEALVLCLVGGAIGITAGLVTSVVSQRTMGWNTAVDPRSIAVAFGFATATGLIFGVWPARRAATLNPVEALRHE